MFKRMLQWLRRLLANDERERQAALSDIIISSEMESAIARWALEYEGNPPWLKKDVKTIGLFSSIAKEIARLVTMEADIQVSGGERASFLQQQLLPFLDALAVNTELGAALGGIVFKPYVSGSSIVIDSVQGDAFYPTTFDASGRMTGVVFVDQLRKHNAIYTRLERHDFQGTSHAIHNQAFVSTNPDTLGKPASLTDIPEWSEIQPDAVFQDVDRPLFGYFRVPFANRIDRHSPLGVSVYADAEHLIRDADEQYSRYLWEYEGGELAVYAADDCLRPSQTQDGTHEMPRHQRRIIRGLQTRDADFYKEYAPQLRDESYKRGLNSILQRIEFSCGLAYGTLSDPQTIEKTAEEVRASKQRSYSTIKSIQGALEAAIIDLVYAMDRFASEYGLGGPSNAYEIAFDWDDSIINDPKERKQMFWQYVSAGKYPMWKYLVEFEGYSEDDAKALSDMPELSNPFGFEGGGSSAST